MYSGAVELQTDILASLLVDRRGSVLLPVVCLSDFLFVQDNSNSYGWIFVKFENRQIVDKKKR